MCQTTKNTSSAIKNNHSKTHIRKDTYFGEVLVLTGLASDGTKSSSSLFLSISETSSSESKSTVNLAFAIKNIHIQRFKEGNRLFDPLIDITFHEDLSFSLIS